MPTPDENKRFLDRHPQLKEIIEQDLLENKSEREAQYNDTPKLPAYFYHAAYIGGWDINNLPDNMAERAFREQQQRKGETWRHGWEQWKENFINNGLKPTIEALYGDVSTREPQYNQTTQYPIYNNPNVAKRSIGSGYWRDQLIQLGTSEGMMAGFFTDPFNIALTVGSFLLPEATIPLLATRIGKTVKAINTASKIAKIGKGLENVKRFRSIQKVGKYMSTVNNDKIAISLANFIVRGGKFGIGARQGYMNARINQQFTQDEVYTQLINKEESPEKAKEEAIKAGEKAFRMEVVANMVFGAIQAGIITRGIHNARTALTGTAAFVNRTASNAATRAARRKATFNFTKDLSLNALQESAEEVWEEMAAVYGESTVEALRNEGERKVNGFFDMFSEDGRKFMFKDMDRYIDSAIGGALGGLLLGLPMKGIFTGAEAVRNYRTKKAVSSAEEKMQTIIKNMHIRPQNIQNDIDKQMAEAAKKVREARDSFDKLKKDGSTRKQRKVAINAIKKAEDNLERLQIENARLDINTLLVLKRSMMSLTDAAPENIMNLNDDFNASLENKIKAINTIQEALTANPNALNEIESSENLTEEQQKLKDAQTILKEVGILQDNNSITDGLKLEDYKKQFEEFYSESINMDTDFVEGFNKYDTQSMASRYMNLNARKRNITKQIDNLSEKANKEVIEEIGKLIGSETANRNDVKKALQLLLSSGFIDDYKKEEVSKIITENFDEEEGISENELSLVSQLMEDNPIENTEEAINAKEQKRKEVRKQLMKSKDNTLRKLITAFSAKTQFVGKKKERFNENVHNLVISATKALHYNKIIRTLDKQSSMIDNILDDMQDEKRQAYHYAKEAYYACCVSYYETAEDVTSMLADVNNAITLCEHKSLANNEEIQTYKEDLQKRYMFLLSKMKEEVSENTYNVSQTISTENENPTSAIDKIRKTLKEVVRTNICNEILEKIKRESNQGDILDFLDDYLSDFDITSSFEVKDSEQKIQITEEVSEKNQKRISEIKDFFDQIKNGETPSSSKNITAEQAKTLNDAIDNTVEEKTVEILEDIEGAVATYEQQELQSAIEDISEKHNLNVVDVIPAVTEMQTTFSDIEIVGCKKSNDIYPGLLTHFVNVIKKTGEDYNTVILPNLNLLLAKFRNGGFTDLTLQDLRTAFETAYEIRKIEPEEKIQNVVQANNLTEEEKKKIGIDYDILQFTTTETNEDGETIFISKVKLNGEAVMTAKGFARLQSLSPNGKNKVFLKGFSGSFSKNKAEFARYLKEIFNYTIKGKSLAKSMILHSLGIDIDIALYNEEGLKNLWEYRDIIFECAIQPVYATDENGNDLVIVGFIPQKDYYSPKNCSLYRYENGTKVLSEDNEINEKIRNENIKKLNYGTHVISLAQRNGDVEFNIGLRDRTTSDINKGEMKKGISATETTLKVGMTKTKGLINKMIYTTIIDNSEGKDTEVLIPIHFPGITFVDNNGNIQVITRATIDKLNLREQNKAFFENFKNNLIDIALKYAVNRLLSDNRIYTDTHFLWNACKKIISENKEILRVDDEKKAIENLFKYVNSRIKNGYPTFFDLDKEIKSKTSGSSRVSKSSFFVSNDGLTGCGFHISVINGKLKLCLANANDKEELDKAQCFIGSESVTDIINLLKYIEKAFSINGIAEKALISILDFRTNNTQKNNSQLSKQVYTDEDCGNNLSQLEDDDFVPNKKTTKTVVDYVNELGETNVQPVSLLDEDGDIEYNFEGIQQKTIYSGIIRTLKRKEGIFEKLINPKKESENIIETIDSLIRETKIRAYKKINMPNIIDGFTPLEQMEMCKSLFAYMLATDSDFKQHLIDNEITVNRCIKRAILLITNERKEVFTSIYSDYEKLRAIYDKLSGNKSNGYTKEYIDTYNYINKENFPRSIEIVKKALDIAEKNMNLIESLGSQENIDKLFHKPKMSDNDVRCGMFTAYIAQVFGAKLTLDTTADIESVAEVLQNDSLDYFLLSDYEKDVISDFSSFLKCVFSTIPSQKTNTASAVVSRSLKSYEDVETVMALTGYAFTQSQCNWDVFLRNLSNMADDKANPYNNICKEIYKVLSANNFPDQYKKEMASKLTKSFVNMMYVYQSKKDDKGKFYITLNSLIGYKKKSNEMSKAKFHCINATYLTSNNGTIEYKDEIIKGYTKQAEEFAKVIFNNKDKTDNKKKEVDINGIQKLVSNIFGVTISSKTITSNIDNIYDLLVKIAYLSKKENQKKTPFDFCRNELSRIIEKECYINENTLDKTAYTNGKLVMSTYFRNLREKIFKDIADGASNVTYDALQDLYKVTVDGKEYWANPQLGMVREYPMETGLVSLSALSLDSGNSDRITELSAEDQAALECVYNSEVYGDTTNDEIELPIHGFYLNGTPKFRVREGYTLTYTVSDKQKLSWIKCQKIVIPMKEYIDGKHRKASAGIDTNKLYKHVAQQILDSELIRIERELSSDTKMPKKTGRHLILSIPELNLIEVNVNGHKQDLESLLRRCYKEETKEVFDIIRNDYRNIFSQAKEIVRNTIERSVANLICNEQAKINVENGMKLISENGELTINEKDMEDSLWHRATVMKLVKTDIGNFMQPLFVSSEYSENVMMKALPVRAEKDNEGRITKEGSIVNANMQIAYIAFDQVVNTYLTNLAMHNICYGPINNISKIKNKNIKELASFDAGSNALYVDGKKNNIAFSNKREYLRSLCRDTAINNTKRMGGADGSGRMLDWTGTTHNNNSNWGGGEKHHNSIFKYIVVAETEKIAPTYKNILELYYGKQNDDIYDLIEKAKTDDSAKDKLKKMFPKVSAYLKIDSTDGAEFVTAREAIDWLYNKGDLSKRKYKKLLSAYEKLGGNLKKSDQKLIWNLMNEASIVMNPNKPMYYGTMLLGKDGNPADDQNKAITMHTFYAKSAAIPLLPEFTANTPWDNVRKVLEATENENNMACRIIFNSAVKVGNPENENIITLSKLINLGERMGLGEKISFDEINKSSIYANRKFQMSQMETNSHREEILQKENAKEKKVMNDIDEFLNNGQTKIVDSTQMEHIIDGMGINKIEGQIFKLPKRVCEQFGIKHDGNYKVNGKEFEKARVLFTKRRVEEAYHDLLEEFGIKSDNDLNFSNSEFVKNLARIIGNELLARGNDPNILQQLGFIENYNKERGTYEFKIPLFLQTKARNIQVLLMAIVRNRLCKNKLPGNPLYTATSEQIKPHIISDQDEAFKKKGIIWLDKSINGILGAQLDENGNLKCADIAIASQFMTRDEDGNMIHLDFYATDDKGKLIYLVGENGQELYVDKDGEITTEHEGIYLNKEMFDQELIDRMMSLRIPVSGHMSGSAVRIVAFLPDSMGDTIVVPAEHFMQLGEDLDIDKRFLYLKNYVVEKDGHVKVFNEEIMKRMLSELENSLDSKLEEYVRNKRKGIDFQTREDAISYALEFELTLNTNKYAEGVYDRYRLKEIILDEYRKKLEQKLRENENIDFYVSIFTNPDKKIQQKIQQVLNFDDLKAMRDLVLSAEEQNGTGFISIFDNTYQSDMRIQNASSLAGVGAMSLAVVQGAMLSKRNINIKGEFRMDGFVSHGELGTGEYVAENLSALQNANVDNAKENVCGPINLNKETFPFYEMMAWLGFNKDSTGSVNLASLVASQPAIKKFVELKTRQKSNLKQRWYSNDDIIRETLAYCGISKERIENIIKGTDEEVEFSDGFFKAKKTSKEDKYGANFFECSSSDLQKGIQDKKPDINTQMKAFMFFYNVLKRAGKITKYSNLLNATSKGIGDSYFDIVQRIRLLNEMGNEKEDKYGNSIKNLIGEFVPFTEATNEHIFIPGCIWAIKPTTTEGIVLLNTLKMSEKILSGCFGYKKNIIRTIYYKIIDNMFAANIPIDKIESSEKQIIEGLKEYIYKLCGDINFLKSVSNEIGTDIQGLWRHSFKDEEKRLIEPYYDEYTLDKNSKFIEAMNEFTDNKPGDKEIKPIKENHANIGYIISFLKRANIQQVIQNKFLSCLEIGKNGIIIYKQKANTLTNSDVTNGFAEMYNNDEVIKINGNNIVVNGEKLTWHKLAEDLAAYAYICDNENGIGNLREHIPESYIEQTKTDVLLRYIYDHMELFVDIDSFIDQYMASNADAMQQLSATKKELHNNLKLIIQGSDVEFNLDTNSINNATGIIIHFPLTQEFVSATGWNVTDGIVDFPPYLSIKSNNKTYIFKYDTQKNMYLKLQTETKEYGKNNYDPTKKVSDFQNTTQRKSAIISDKAKVEIIPSNNKIEIAEQIRSRLTIGSPAAKIINLLLEGIIANDNIFVTLNRITDPNIKNSTEFKAENKKFFYTLNLKDSVTESQLAEEMMHLATLAEIRRSYKEENKKFVPKNVENDFLRTTYDIFCRFEKWWAANGKEFKRKNKKMLEDNLYENQIDPSATDFAEFVAAGVSMNPAFVKLIETFEKDIKMTEGNVFEQLISAIQRIFKKLIETLFSNMPETIKTMIDDTFKAINAHFLSLDYAAMISNNPDITKFVDNRILEITQEIDKAIFLKNDETLNEISEIDDTETPINNVKEQYRGKIVVAPYGVGKSTAANNENVIDMDYIWAETIASLVSPNELAQFNGIIEADRWVEQHNKTSLAWGRITQEVVNRCNKFLAEGKTILASPTILNGRYGNLIEKVGAVIGIKNMKDEVVTNLLKRKHQFKNNAKEYGNILEEQLKALRAFADKSKMDVFADQYVSDVIYDNPSKQQSPKNAFIVSFDDQGQRMVQPIRIDDTDKAEVAEKQEVIAYPDLC